MEEYTPAHHDEPATIRIDRRPSVLPVASGNYVAVVFTFPSGFVAKLSVREAVEFAQSLLDAASELHG